MAAWLKRSIPLPAAAPIVESEPPVAPAPPAEVSARPYEERKSRLYGAKSVEKD